MIQIPVSEKQTPGTAETQEITLRNLWQGQVWVVSVSDGHHG